MNIHHHNHFPRSLHGKHCWPNGSAQRRIALESPGILHVIQLLVDATTFPCESQESWGKNDGNCRCAHLSANFGAVNWVGYGQGHPQHQRGQCDIPFEAQSADQLQLLSMPVTSSTYLETCGLIMTITLGLWGSEIQLRTDVSLKFTGSPRPTLQAYNGIENSPNVNNWQIYTLPNKGYAVRLGILVATGPNICLRSHQQAS